MYIQYKSGCFSWLQIINTVELVIQLAFWPRLACNVDGSTPSRTLAVNTQKQFTIVWWSTLEQLREAKSSCRKVL